MASQFNFGGIVGRVAKPTSLKHLQGTYRPDRVAPNEPMPDRGKRTPAMPAWLPEPARAIWKAEARLRWDLGVLTPADVDAFARLCHWRALYQQAADELKNAGLVQITPQGYQQVSGWLTALGKAEANIARLEREFGGTPASRTRISAVTEPEEAADPYEAFLSSETVARRKATGT